MTSYDRAEVADVDPVYGLQLHHPRFLEYVGAPESARLLTRHLADDIKCTCKDQRSIISVKYQTYLKVRSTVNLTSNN